MKHHIGKGIFDLDSSFGTVDHTSPAMPALVRIPNCGNLSGNCRTKYVQGTDLGTQGAAGTFFLVDDGGHGQNLLLQTAKLRKILNMIT